jgi:predicted transposase YdaD
MAEQSISKETGEYIMTLAEKLRKEGEEKGKLEGKLEGLRETIKTAKDISQILARI